MIHTLLEQHNVYIFKSITIVQIAQRLHNKSQSKSFYFVWFEIQSEINVHLWSFILITMQLRGICVKRNVKVQ